VIRGDESRRGLAVAGEDAPAGVGAFGLLLPGIVLVVAVAAGLALAPGGASLVRGGGPGRTLAAVSHTGGSVA
jgi:hypothetical protein